MEEDLSEETVDSSDEDRVTRVTRVHRVDGDVSAVRSSQPHLLRATGSQVKRHLTLTSLCLLQEEEGEVPGVAMETVENSCQNQRRKKTMKSSE